MDEVKYDDTSHFKHCCIVSSKCGIVFVDDGVVVMLEMSMFYEGDRRVPGQCLGRRGQLGKTVYYRRGGTKIIY